ncbi:MAG TPA: hypothetical protein DIW37_11850 [Chryseobacterium sp.]|nr:hypothetical protein [Chryseobacterium sp.]
MKRHPFLLRAERSGACNKKDTVESRKQLLKKLKIDNISFFMFSKGVISEFLLQYRILKKKKDKRKPSIL